MVWEEYREAPRLGLRPSALKRRYSVTADVVSYSRCPRQYGFFDARRYEPAHAVQLFFGTAIHQTLDRVHAHYRGEMSGAARGQIPSEERVTAYFDDVVRGLRARRIFPWRKKDRDVALEYVLAFHRIYSGDLYPRVIDTEHRLQADQDGFILFGVADLLIDAETAKRRQTTLRTADFSRGEIWDYKGSRRPDNPHDLEIHEFQMRVYAHLYRCRNGVLPARAVLVYLGELLDENGARRESQLRRAAEHAVVFDEASITGALDDFNGTVREIEESTTHNSWPAPPPDRLPSQATCDTCDLRYNCRSAQRRRRYRLPFR